MRSRDAVVAGVCSGLAAHLGWTVRRVRLIMVIATVLGGAGVLLYGWLWALVPLEQPHDAEPAPVRRSAPVGALLATTAGLAALSAIAALMAADDRLATLFLAVTSVASGGAVAWSLGFDRSDPTRSRAFGWWVRGGSAAAVLLAGTTALLTRPSAVNAVLGVGMVVLGAAVVIAPQVVSLWTDLMAERAARVREVQRAEIAAHLHDSVLQTLALIQNRAGASSEVARIARAQERELRDWLFAGDEQPAADLATELRGIAAAIELDFAVRIEVVAVGELVSTVPTALVAAAREAMLNAARHAGGEVSVYVETSGAGDATVVDVFVRDRGAGVSLGDVPADRLGIRESIIGRMSRAGGTATVRPGAGGTGTEVHLHLEVPHD